MHQRSGLQVVLGAIGVLALFIYVLACRPSWSPDGSKILFRTADSTGLGVALLDVKTGAARMLFEVPISDDSNAKEMIAAVQWARDGQRAIAVLIDNVKVTRLLLLPVGSKQPARLVFMEELHAQFEYVTMPLPERNGQLFIPGNKLARVDLETGLVRSWATDSVEAVSLAEQDGSIVYAMESRREPKGWEFGEVDPESLTLRPFLRLEQADLAARIEAAGLGFKGLSLPHLAPEPHGTRLALKAETSQGDVIVVLDRGGFRQVARTRPEPAGCTIGNLQWAPGGRLLYAVDLMHATGSDTLVQYSLGEVPLDGGPARLDPIVRFQYASGPNWDDFNYQIALSPDGRRIATMGSPESREDGAPYLYLIDLRSPQRRTIRIPMPGLAGSRMN
jgi:hypothetical protein